MPSKGINKVMLIGNLGQDPESRYMPNGKAVANVSLATSESWTDKGTGELREKTEWHRLVFFDRLAEVVQEYLKKGSKIYAEGKLQTRKWEKDGQDHYTTEIVVNTMQMLDARTNTDGAPTRSPATNDQPTTPDQAQVDYDDDIPF